MSDNTQQYIEVKVGSFEKILCRLLLIKNINKNETGFNV